MKKIKKILTVLFACMLISSTAFAHSGRTDSAGGHHDYKNVSGLGSYHYHHGYSAHLHPNGICPYSSAAQTTSSKPKSTSSPSSTTAAPKVQVEKTLPTDIKAYIDSYFIPSVNYKDSQFVVAEDLSSYGYDVNWDASERTLKISKNSAKTKSAIALNNPSEQYEIKSSDIKTYLYNSSTGNYDLLTSYNIGGKTIVKFSQLGETVWNSSARSSTLSY